MFYLKISIRNLKVCIFVFLIKIESSTDNDNDILAGTIPVNNFFAHWLKEGDKKNGDHIPVLPLTNTVDIYKYSEAMLKHIPEKALETFEETLLYSKKGSSYWR